MDPDSEQRSTDWPEGVGMIYLAMSPWEGMWKNRHQLMSRFAQVMPVIYVEPWVRLRRLRRDGLSALSNLAGKETAQVVQKAPGLFVYKSPRSRPVSASRYLERFTANHWLRGVRGAAEEVGITRPILWLSLPEMHFAVGKMNELLSIYHVVDEYGGYARQSTKNIQRLRGHERKMLESVDLSIVVSPELAKAKATFGKKIHVLENAVDFAAFSEATTNGEIPDDIRSVPYPRMGYSGLIGQRLDLDLMIRVAREKPEWSLVLVGKVDETDCADKLSILRALPNVHFLGEKTIDEVPDYVAAFDIGLLPYALNLETKNISPLKLYEYFAVGIPVVSTPIPSALRHQDVLLIADTDDAFINACSKSLTSHDDELGGTRTSRARKNTWDRRINQATRLLTETLREREASNQ